MNNNPISRSTVNRSGYGVLSPVVIGLIFLMLTFGSSAFAAGQRGVAIVIASKDYSVAQFKELEKAFQENNIRFKVVSTKLGEAKSGHHVLRVDHLIETLDVESFDAVVFVGGFGAVDELLDNDDALNLSRQAAVKGMVVAGS